MPTVLELNGVLQQLGKTKCAAPPQHSAGDQVLEASAAAMHGRLGDASWPAPKMVLHSNETARPGYSNTKAHEYNDTPAVLRAKVLLLVTAIRKARNCVAYTGAGISTASGIADYATRRDSTPSQSTALSAPVATPTTPGQRSGLTGCLSIAQQATTGRHSRSPMDAEPTLCHHVLTAMHGAGLLMRWFQQNHDGLPQKAGCPQHAINEIHGALYDPSNPVVMMSGELRSDLFADALAWEQRTDLCLALGTSLAGMNADRVATTVAAKARRGEAGAIGLVIISLQATQADEQSAIRIFGKIDKVMALLSAELCIGQDAVPPLPLRTTVAGEGGDGSGGGDVIALPYGSDGARLAVGSAPQTLDMREGALVQITKGPFAGDEGLVVGKSLTGHYRIKFMHTIGKRKFRVPMERQLGRWWLDEAARGKVESFPLTPIAAGQGSVCFDEGDEDGETSGEVSGAREVLPDWVRVSYLEEKRAASGGTAGK